MSVVKQLGTDFDVSKGTHKEALKLGYKDATVSWVRRSAADANAAWNADLGCASARRRPPQLKLKGSVGLPRSSTLSGAELSLGKLWEASYEFKSKVRTIKLGCWTSSKLHSAPTAARPEKRGGEYLGCSVPVRPAGVK